MSTLPAWVELSTQFLVSSALVFFEIFLKSTLLLVLAWISTLLLRSAASSVRHHIWLLAIVAVLALGSFASGRSLVRSQQAFPTGFKALTWHSAPARIAVAKELREIIPPGQRLALFEAGYIPYFNPQLDIMDNSGLMERHIARMPGPHMAKMTAEYFLEQSPEYFLTMVKQGRISGDAQTLRENPEFLARYERVGSLGGALPDAVKALASGDAEAVQDEEFVLYHVRGGGATAVIP